MQQLRLIWRAWRQRYHCPKDLVDKWLLLTLRRDEVRKCLDQLTVPEGKPTTSVSMSRCSRRHHSRHYNYTTPDSNPTCISFYETFFFPWKHFCLPLWRRLPGGRMVSPVALFHWCQNYCQIFPRDLPVSPSVPDWLRISALQYTPQVECLSALPSRSWGGCGYSLTWKETFLFFWSPGCLQAWHSKDCGKTNVIFSEESFLKDSSSARV